MVYGASLLQNHHHSRVLFNATRKWAYPPVWVCQAKYSLGNWTKQNEEYAKLIVEGKYRQVGEKTAERQQTVSSEDIIKEDIAIGR